jgi:hypothetical protein
MCLGAESACACTLPIPVVFRVFLAVTNFVSPGPRGLAAASPNCVAKRFTLLKAKTKRRVTNLARHYGIHVPYWVLNFIVLLLAGFSKPVRGRFADPRGGGRSYQLRAINSI